MNKFGPLSKFFNSVLDGTADLKVADEEAKAEEAVHETQAKQEARHIPFPDGGETIKGGHGTGHDVHGEVGRKENALPQEATKDTKSEPEVVVAQKTGEDEQVVLEAVIEAAEPSVVVEVDEITTTTTPSFPSPEPVEQLKSEDAERPRDEL